MATVISNVNLASLQWLPPESSGPLPNSTAKKHDGNVTNTTFILLKDATSGDSGKYNLSAVNKCGHNSSQVEVDVVTSKTIVYNTNA